MAKALFVGGPAHGTWRDTDGAPEWRVPAHREPGPEFGYLPSPIAEVYWRRTIDLLGRRGWVYIHTGSHGIVEMLLFELLVSEEGKKVCGF